MRNILLLILLFMSSQVYGRLALSSATVTTCQIGSTTVSGVKHYWQFNEGTGTSVTDNSGSGYTGTLKQSDHWVAGKVGKAYSYDGTDDACDVGVLPIISSVTAISISLWVNPTAFADQKVMYAASSNDASQFVLIEYSGVGGAFVTQTNKGAAYVAHTTENILSTGKWYFIVVTIDLSLTDANKIKTYVNGQLIPQVTVAGSASLTSTSSYTANCIGALHYGANYTGYINSVIDEVVLYQKILTPAEIQYIYWNNPQ